MKRGPTLPPCVTLRAGQFMEAHELCEALRCSRASLAHWRKTFGAPQFLKKGRSALVETASVAAWLYKFPNVTIFWI